MINNHFTPEQTRDTRFIPPPTKIPHTQISIIECNPKNDIVTTKNNIQTLGEITHIYEDTGKFLITIPTTRLKWLWQQYHYSNHSTHGPIPPHTTIWNRNNMALPKIQTHKPKKQPTQRSTTHPPTYHPWLYNKNIQNHTIIFFIASNMLYTH